MAVNRLQNIAKAIVPVGRRSILDPPAIPPSLGGVVAQKAESPPLERPTALVYRVPIYTYFTRALLDQTDTIYQADQAWARVKLTLETAGPVAVGTQAALTPVLSGAGALLPTGEEREFILPTGSNLYISSPTINRVTVVIEQLPWLEELARTMRSGFGALAGLLQALRRPRAAGPVSAPAPTIPCPPLRGRR